MQNELVPFEGKEIRKVWHDEQWFFSAVDVIEVLTDTAQPASYWNKVKKSILSDSQLLPFWQKLKLVGQDGRKRPSDCADTEGVFRIIQSVPSPKAEPFKLWLAALGKQAIDETENPELLSKRQAEIYKAKGYSDEWIGRRVQSMDTRKELTTEWKNRGVKEGHEYSILTATIAKGTFGLTPSEHSKFKGLDKENLRDHMTSVELILTALSEEATKAITIKNEAQGFNESHDAAVRGGQVGMRARQNFEEATGDKVVSSQNFLDLKGGESPKALPEEDKTK